MQATQVQAIRLFLLGFITLFLELLLIRYLSGNIWNLGYFPNLVLIGVFIGMGTGFIFHHYLSQRVSDVLFWLAVGLLTLLMVGVRVARPSLPGFAVWEGDFGGDLYFTFNPASAGSIWVSVGMFAVWFLLVVTIFFCISQKTAKYFRLFSPLTAYTWDIAGSCCGILGFMLISWGEISAPFWFLVLVPVFLFVMGREAISWKGATLLVMLCVCGGIAWQQDTQLLASPKHQEFMRSHWSPYQKIEFTLSQKNPLFHRQIFVNGIFHQQMATKEKIQRSWYQLPYQLRSFRKLPMYQNVLIIGAGSGNDVSAALMHPVQRVDAVEIDPVIARLGKEFHPVKPYQDKRVTLTVTDGRAFMTQTRRKYDLIIFALTDSLVKASPMAQLRLENYLFTVESIKRASQILSPTGDLMLYNFYRKPWLREKIQQMLYQGTGTYPQIIYQRKDFAVLLAGKSFPAGAAVQTKDIQVPRDNWPFLYLKEKHLPSIYFAFMLFLSSFVVLLFLVFQRISKHRKEEAFASQSTVWLKVAFVSMGIAFLLLETKSIIQFSLLFGTTWLNNSLVFLAVLVSILAANWVAVLIPRSWSTGVFLLLLISCLAAIFYPLTNLLLIESAFVRFVLASLMTFSPIFFANLIFSMAFRDLKIAEHIFGWNLLGATVGGAIEYLSLLTGYQALAWVVILCYTITFLSLIMARRSPPEQREFSNNMGSVAEKA